jgi:hypothetical protein
MARRRDWSANVGVGRTVDKVYVCVLANAAVTPASTSDLAVIVSGIKDQP